MNFILDTISAWHDVNDYLGLLNFDGKLVMVGASPTLLAANPKVLSLGRRSWSGSYIGGMRETQDMLDFCGRHNITCDIEIITADNINQAYDRILKSDVKYRFVIDTNSIL